MKIALTPANYNHLIRFAQQNGLDVKHGKTNAVQVIDLIRSAYPGVDAVELDDDSDFGQPAVKPAAAPISGISTHHSHDPKVEVNIASDPLNGGKQPWPITAGDATPLLVQRDEWVAIPYRHFCVLENAVEVVITQETNPITGVIEDIHVPQKAVRYSVRSQPTQAEIDEWFERTKDIDDAKARKAA